MEESKSGGSGLCFLGTLPYTPGEMCGAEDLEGVQ